VGRLHELYDQHRQSPWLDNLSRDSITDGTLRGWLDRGIRGVTSNPSIFQKAMTAGSAYDDQLASLVRGGASTEDAFWTMAMDDIRNACAELRPVFDASGGSDGFVSLEVAPALAHDEGGTTKAALSIHDQIDLPNLMVKIPATAEGVGAIRDTIAAGRNVNVTLIFSLDRYAEVMDAYLTGLERLLDDGGDVARVQSVGSFFISRVDTEVDKRLPEGSPLRGKAAVAQGKLAYALFQETFSGPRWERLETCGANVQRPLWASTSTKDPSLPDTLYVDTLIAPNTVNTMPEGTIEAFEDHGTVARTADAGVDEARETWAALAEAGVDLDDVAAVLEREGVAAFAKAFDDLLSSLDEKAATLR